MLVALVAQALCGLLTTNSLLKVCHARKGSGLPLPPSLKPVPIVDISTVHWDVVLVHGSGAQAPAALIHNLETSLD